MSVPPLAPLATAVLRVGSPERVLVAERGEGEAALFLAREFPSARVRGVEPDEASVRRAAARVGLDPEGRVAFKLGRPRKLPFPEDQFDLLVLVDDDPAPRESARVLRSSGRLLLVRTGSPPPGGFRARLMDRRLAARGFGEIESTEAGEGSFSLWRLGGAELGAASL